MPTTATKTASGKSLSASLSTDSLGNCFYADVQQYQPGPGCSLAIVTKLNERVNINATPLMRQKHLIITMTLQTTRTATAKGRRNMPPLHLNIKKPSLKSSTRA